MKKIAVSVLVCSIMLLSAGQAFAAAYAKGSAITVKSSALSPSPSPITQADSSAGNRMYINTAPNTMSFQRMPAQTYMPLYANAGVVWWGIMIVITFALVWANLLLLFIFLWKQVKKHEHK